VEHCTPEQLTLAALREPLPADDAAHLEACDRCRAEVASLQRAVDPLTVPEFAGSVAPVTPPPAVWAAIAAATGVSAAPPAADAPPGLSPVPPAATDNVRELRPRRTRLLLAAAAVAVVAAGAGVIALNRDDEVVLASTTLDPLETADASGTASVVEEDDGTRMLLIELDAPAADGDYYEAWLADESAVGMVSMGAVRPGTTSLPVPDGLDLAEWPTVEISVEPLDGEPGHSGVSLVRGSLDT
jgi:anti-sigma factor RsiW